MMMKRWEAVKFFDTINENYCTYELKLVTKNFEAIGKQSL